MTTAGTMSAAAIVEAFAEVVGAANARPAGPEDAVDGVAAKVVVEPASVEETAEVMRRAAAEGLASVTRGTATKLTWGAPPARLDLVVSTRRLDQLLEQAQGDLVVRAQAGVPLAVLQKAVAGAGQMLALDPPDGAGTLGGIVATSVSGPRRQRYGTVRDLLIGITVVLADGTIAHAGGRVVKNVAGYDLCKLFTGSFGTLGIIVETIFRLHPQPAESATVIVATPTPEAAAGAVQTLLHQSAVVPSAIEVDWATLGPTSRGEISVLIEGQAAAVAAQVEACRRLLDGAGTVAVLTGDHEHTKWRELRGTPWSPGDVGCGLSITPASLADAVEAVLECAGAAGGEASVAGRAGVGALLVGVSHADPERLAIALERLRARVAPDGGSLVVLEAPLELKQRLDVWGPVGDAGPLMERVKLRFDPGGLLARGRFVGGL